MFDVSSSGFCFKKILHRQGSRVLCLGWHENGEYIAVGGIDSSVRIIDVSSGTCTQRITLSDYLQKTTLLWDVMFLGKSTIVTASSLGRVEMWDFNHGTLQSTFNQHSADVLTLTSHSESNEGSNVFASGVDSMILKISTVEKRIGDTNDTHAGWIMTGKIRPHQHDVLSLHLSCTGMLASGGVEGELVITDTTRFTESAYVKYQPFPCITRNFQMTEDGNVFIFQDISTVSVWCISLTSAVMRSGCNETCHTHDPPSVPLSMGSSFQPTAPYCLLELKAKPPHNILSSAISSDGSIIAISNAFEMWIYHFDASQRQLLLLTRMLHSAMAILFKPNEHILFFATPLHGLQCATLSTHNNVTVSTILNDRGIKYFDCSANGQYLAVITKHWRIKLLDVVGGTVIAKLPKLQSVPILFTFKTNKPQLVIFVGGKCREVFVYHILENNLRLVGNVQRMEQNEGRMKFSHPLSIFPVTFEKNLFGIYDNDSVLMFRLVSDSEYLVSSKHLPIQLIKTASLVLFVGSFCNSTGSRTQGGLMIFERSQKDILQVLPPTLYRKRYGS